MDAKAFYGENPFQTDITKASDSFQARAVKIDKRSTGPAHEQLVKSYNAAINLALAKQTIALSRRTLADLNSKIEALEAAAQVEAEIDRIAAEAAAQAEAARIAAHHELMRQANTFSAAGAAAIAGPLLVTPAGTVLSTLSLLGEIKASILVLRGLGAGVLAGFAVGTFAMLYPSRLGNGELPARYVLQTPLAELDSDLASTLANGSVASTLVDLPYRFGSKTGEAGSSEIFTATSDGQLVPPQVRVIAATYDTQRNLYSVTTADDPPRTLTWTPVVTPGDASTVTPIEHIEPPVYEGATLTPVEARVDSYPGLGDASWDDYVIVFPADSGLPPLYVIFRDRRDEPGQVSGTGEQEAPLWLESASQGFGVAIPKRIADRLTGQAFQNWRVFRQAFWNAVGEDEVLTRQFNASNVARLKKGYSPRVRAEQSVGGRTVYELHHQVPLSKGGELYNLDNIRVTTPKLHIEIHRRNN